VNKVSINHNNDPKNKKAIIESVNAEKSKKTPLANFMNKENK